MVTPLKLERLKRGITTEQLALEIGTTQATLSRIENGQRHPSLALANKIAKHLGNVTRDQILFPEDYVDVTARKEGTPPTQLQKAS